MKKDQRGFTLTELLVVVLLLGILASAVLPKFTKVIDSFRVLEAERIVVAIRGEQEQRCLLDKKYTQTPSKLTVIPGGVSVNGNVFSYGDFEYTLSYDGGMTALHKDKNYLLEMPSYTDGRICCDNCDGLNKNYQPCSDLMDTDITENYQEPATECL